MPVRTVSDFPEGFSDRVEGAIVNGRLFQDRDPFLGGLLREHVVEQWHEYAAVPHLPRSPGEARVGDRMLAARGW